MPTKSHSPLEDEIWSYLEEAGWKNVGGRPKSAELAAALAEMRRLTNSGLSVERAAKQVFEDEAFPTGNNDYEGLTRGYHLQASMDLVDDIAQAIVDDDEDAARPKLTEFLRRNRKGATRRGNVLKRPPITKP